MAAYSFVEPPLRWLAVRSGRPFRVDVDAELVAAFAATAIMLRSIDQRGWDAIDLTRAAAHPRRLLTGWCMGGFPIAIACAALLATGLLQFTPSIAQASWMGAALRTTLVLLPAALAEELICRGYLLTVLRDSVGARAAVLGTSVLFGLLHLENPGATAVSLTVVLLSGVLLASVRLALNSLYAAWLAHFAWNWVMAVPFHAKVSALEFESPLYKAVTTGPAWLSGGDWGPEGGLVAALSMVAAIAYIYTRYRRGET
jgi:membrane protease YdiL (CAAX protease family)